MNLRGVIADLNFEIEIFPTIFALMDLHQVLIERLHHEQCVQHEKVGKPVVL